MGKPRLRAYIPPDTQRRMRPLVTKGQCKVQPIPNLLQTDSFLAVFTTESSWHGTLYYKTTPGSAKK
eukprot:766510-Hanusia_phi.AAC.3